MAVATLCDQSAFCTRDPAATRAEVADMTGLEAWKVSEIIRSLVRDGLLVEAEGRLIVA
ncbi:MAG: hypothetical protein M3203_08645 [Actinomycetota bacterium]|nr:hypothetical protein [Actinomycetota bacterium]